MRVLVVRFSSLGDLVLTTGPLDQLTKQRSDIKVDFLTSETGFHIFKNNTKINQCLVVKNQLKTGKLLKFYRNLPDYDVIIDWQGNLKSQILRLFSKARFFTVKKQSKERRAFVKNRRFKEKLDKHIVEKYYQVLKKVFGLEDRTLESLRPKLSVPDPDFAFNKSFNNPNSVFKKQNDFSNSIVIHPYASQKNKLWPYTKTLVEKLHEKQFSVIVIGQSEKSIEPIGFKKSSKTMDLTNKTTICETLSIVKQSKALITTDSGPMHLGVALKTPTLALFGPTTKEFGFSPRFKNTKVLEVKNLDCRPCHIHGGNSCPKKHFKCMKELSVDEVLKELDRLLEKRSG